LHVWRGGVIAQFTQRHHRLVEADNNLMPSSDSITPWYYSRDVQGVSDRGSGRR
jgi:hypothetical protein